MRIEAGTFLLVTTASGEKVPMRAIGAPLRGRDFPIVWVTALEEYEEALAEGAGGKHVIPWPVEAVEVTSPATA